MLDHKFFRGINLQKIEQRSYKAPYKPLKPAIDLSEVGKTDASIKLESDQEIPEQQRKLVDSQQERFKSFGRFFLGFKK